MFTAMKFICPHGGEPVVIVHGTRIWWRKQIEKEEDGTKFIKLNCRDTGWKDAKGLPIYEKKGRPSGWLFVWDYEEGAPWEGEKDKGTIREPYCNFPYGLQMPYPGKKRKPKEQEK